MWPIICLEALLRNCHYTLRNIPEEHRSQEGICLPMKLCKQNERQFWLHLWCLSWIKCEPLHAVHCISQINIKKIYTQCSYWNGLQVVKMRQTVTCLLHNRELRWGSLCTWTFLTVHYSVTMDKSKNQMIRSVKYHRHNSFAEITWCHKPHHTATAVNCRKLQCWVLSLLLIFHTISCW
jgi:hypothetical protein